MKKDPYTKHNKTENECTRQLLALTRHGQRGDRLSDGIPDPWNLGNQRNNRHDVEQLEQRKTIIFDGKRADEEFDNEQQEAYEDDDLKTLIARRLKHCNSV
jgi:hypothetical protein